MLYRAESHNGWRGEDLSPMGRIDRVIEDGIATLESGRGASDWCIEGGY